MGNPSDERIADLLDQGSALVLMTLVRAKLGARKPGTRALVTQQGLEGTIGGGPFEHSVCREAEAVLAERTSAFFAQSATDDRNRGQREVLLEYLESGQAQLFRRASEAEDGLFLVRLTTPYERTLILPRDILPGDDDGVDEENIRCDATLHAELLRKCGGASGCIVLDGTPFYCEPKSVLPRLVLFGAGHVAQATAALALECGFSVEVIDEREALLTEERFPQAKLCLASQNFGNLTEICTIGQHAYVLIMTHSHELDELILRFVLPSPARYIGMLGGREKRAAIFAHLKAQGIPEAELACVSSPVGLPIGAETPYEIAVSIVAELIAERAGTRLYFKNQGAV
ncbi:MAG: XdhC family protein [Desulfovibrionaceae bacterium]|nr:XdhC family protein [Desulfovibrionaceae bacterium]